MSSWLCRNSNQCTECYPGIGILVRLYTATSLHTQYMYSMHRSDQLVQLLLDYAYDARRAVRIAGKCTTDGVCGVSQIIHVLYSGKFLQVKISLKCCTIQFCSFYFRISRILGHGNWPRLCMSRLSAGPSHQEKSTQLPTSLWQGISSPRTVAQLFL